MELLSRPAAPELSQFDPDMRADLQGSSDLGSLGTFDAVSLAARRGRQNLWLIVSTGGAEVLAWRHGPNAGEITNLERSTIGEDAVQFEYATALGPLRTKVVFPSAGRPAIHCTTSLLPAADTAILYWPRDLYVLGNEEGKIYTCQRGLRTGIVFAGADSPAAFSLFYLQDFSSLTEYLEAVRRSPGDTVGGKWPELGYAPPAGDGCVLPKAREFVVSDAYLSVRADSPDSDEAAARSYLDLLAQTYLCLSHPEVAYHDWPRRAHDALRDLSLSPACTYERKGERYVMPYVRDETKPPESMVQLTAAVNVKEYEAWRGHPSTLGGALCSNVSTFYDSTVESVVRWLPGEPFEPSQAEENMNHKAMDSWYLHHALFNLSRLAQSGDARAKRMFRQSLPYAVRVARRFDYRWPIFFGLRSLDVIRAEASPGKGGEFDVAGLYALVMLQAYDMFEDEMYRKEAEAAASRLEGLGFKLAYQLNTTGFAAEAMMRLWKLTKDRRYLGLSEICMANVFDNMWLWRCDYARAKHYRTYFGLFPLREAPYLAAYEELEAQAKFWVYLELGGEDVRPSLRLLIAEFQKFALDRTWYYYPDALSPDGVSDKPRNGCIERSLSIPLEDLQDGREVSGQVGQEVYGAGLPFVMTTRYFHKFFGDSLLANCTYPAYDFLKPGVREEAVTFRTGGDPRGSCELRVIPASSDVAPIAVEVTVRAGKVRVPVRGSITPEGHALFELRGGMHVEIICRDLADVSGVTDDGACVIGSTAARRNP